MGAVRTLTVRVSAFAILLAATLLGGGCTTFNHEWRTATGNPIPQSDLQGPWQGTWASDATGHTGKLRCLITKTDTGIYQARFHAKYRKLLSFGYTVRLNLERTANSFTFRGEADLGWLAGGVYHYDGHADATNFFSKYSSKYDHGIFQMARPYYGNGLHASGRSN
jgi:hypothetical protein